VYSVISGFLSAIALVWEAEGKLKVLGIKAWEVRHQKCLYALLVGLLLYWTPKIDM